MLTGRFGVTPSLAVRAALNAVIGFALLTSACERGSGDAPVESEAARLGRDGRARLTDGDKKAARAHFQRALEVAPREPDGRLGLALLEVLEGNTPAAQEHLIALRASGLDPAGSAPWLTALLDARRHFPAAIPAIIQDGTKDDTVTAPVASAAPTGSTDPGPVEGDAPLTAAFRAGDYEAVRRAVEPELKPSLFRLKLLADAYYNLQDWTRAVRTYRLVLREEPGNEPVTQYLADALVRLGRLDDAMTFYRVLAENNPTRPGFWRLIGDAAAQKGDLEVAVASYTKALNAGYDDPTLPATLARLQSELANPSPKAAPEPAAPDAAVPDVGVAPRVPAPRPPRPARPRADAPADPAAPTIAPSGIEPAPSGIEPAPPGIEPAPPPDEDEEDDPPPERAPGAEAPAALPPP
ncbi:MAG: tetratricopeptide repeat protein [Myxococcales bacterium]|nr:tetratricopeptide repeat protein [Myxococcales bacterium]